MNTTQHTCPTCGKPSDPASTRKRYCPEHKAAASAAFKAMIANRPSAADRDATFAALYEKAQKAGEEAVKGFRPTPMLVAQHEHPLDDNSPVTEAWLVNGGVCGFAWVNIRPANSSFALWLKRTGKASNAYGGGLNIRIRGYGQSYETKMRHAHAMAEVLREAGIKAFSDGRLD